MTTLAYANPASTPPRYGRLALGSAALAIVYLMPLMLLLARWLLSSMTLADFFRWSQLISNCLSGLLVLTAAAAFATFRRSASRASLALWTSLAALHGILNITIGIANFGRSFRRPLAAVEVLLLGSHGFNQLVYLALLIAALVFVVRLRMTPITILAFICFAPMLVLVPYRTAAVLEYYIGGTDYIFSFVPIMFLTYFNAPALVLFLLWLTLTILALVLAARSRTYPQTFPATPRVS